jgi:hypothetical protein
MRRERSSHKRSSPYDALLSDLDPPQNGHVRRNPTVITDHDRLDLLDPFGIEIVLVRIEDTRARTDPDPMADV